MMSHIFKMILLTAFFGTGHMIALDSFLHPTHSIEPFNISADDIDCMTHKALAMFNVPGAAVGIVINDQIPFFCGYGFRDVARELPVTEHTLFPIASCTKAFTALILGQLVDEERIAWDDPVKKYIPEFCLLEQDRENQLTICDLLAHRTGIPRHDPIWFFSELPRSAVLTLLPSLEPACELRQEFQYNNFMYSVAGMVVERVTGQSWEEALSHRLFALLKMKDSNTSLQELKGSADFALPYAEINGILTNIPFRNPHVVNPAAGINSSVLDIVNWLKLQLGEDYFYLIDQETLQESHTIQMPFSSSQNKDEGVFNMGYGLGWFIGKYRGYDLISHNGDIDGFSSQIAFLPEKKIGIVILTNSSSDGRSVISSIRNQILDKVLRLEEIDWIEKIKVRTAQAKNILRDHLDLFNENRPLPPVNSLEAYVGNYQHPAYGNIELKIEDNSLWASFGKLNIALHFKSDDVWTGQFSELLNYRINPLIDFTFFKDSSGHIYQVEIPFEAFRSAKPITFMRQ